MRKRVEAPTFKVGVVHYMGMKVTITENNDSGVYEIRKKPDAVKGWKS